MMEDERLRIAFNDRERAGRGERIAIEDGLALIIRERPNPLDHSVPAHACFNRVIIFAKASLNVRRYR